MPTHTAKRAIQTAVAVAPPASPTTEFAVDTVGFMKPPGAAIYYAKGATTDDTKFTSGELITLVARGDLGP